MVPPGTCATVVESEAQGTPVRRCWPQNSFPNAKLSKSGRSKSAAKHLHFAVLQPWKQDVRDLFFSADPLIGLKSSAHEHMPVPCHGQLPVCFVLMLPCTPDSGASSCSFPRAAPVGKPQLFQVLRYPNRVLDLQWSNFSFQWIYMGMGQNPGTW